MGGRPFCARRLLCVHERPDPTRIPRVIAALQRAWEGQPELSLPALMGVLTNRGIGWGATDAELISALGELEKEHPALLDAHPAAPYTITTESPARQVTLSAGVAVVRSGESAEAMPGVWAFESLRRTGPGRPLVVRDTEGIEHRLGVVRLISRLDAASAPILGGLERAEVGAHRWLVVLQNGARAVVGQRIRVWEKHRREVTSRAYNWQRMLACAPGQDMVFSPVGGGPAVALGRVEDVIVLEAG